MTQYQNDYHGPKLLTHNSSRLPKDSGSNPTPGSHPRLPTLNLWTGRLVMEVVY